MVPARGTTKNRNLLGTIFQCAIVDSFVKFIVPVQEGFETNKMNKNEMSNNA